jgi:hypothetical protein
VCGGRGAIDGVTTVIVDDRRRLGGHQRRTRKMTDDSESNFELEMTTLGGVVKGGWEGDRR